MAERTWNDFFGEMVKQAAKPEIDRAKRGQRAGKAIAKGGEKAAVAVMNDLTYLTDPQVQRDFLQGRVSGKQIGSRTLNLVGSLYGGSAISRGRDVLRASKGNVLEAFGPARKDAKAAASAEYRKMGTMGSKATEEQHKAVWNKTGAAYEPQSGQYMEWFDTTPNWSSMNNPENLTEWKGPKMGWFGQKEGTVTGREGNIGDVIRQGWIHDFPQTKAGKVRISTDPQNIRSVYSEPPQPHLPGGSDRQIVNMALDRPTSAQSLAATFDHEVGHSLWNEAFDRVDGRGMKPGILGASLNQDSKGRYTHNDLMTYGQNIGEKISRAGEQVTLDQSLRSLPPSTMIARQPHPRTMEEFARMQQADQPEIYGDMSIADIMEIYESGLKK